MFIHSEICEFGHSVFLDGIIFNPFIVTPRVVLMKKKGSYEAVFFCTFSANDVWPTCWLIEDILEKQKLLCVCVCVCGRTDGHLRHSPAIC